MYKIIQAPSDVLSSIAKKVVKIDDSIKKLVVEMTKTLEEARDPEGVGLAAPQIGKSLQIFVVKESSTSPVLVFINPHIDEYIDEKKPHSKTSPPLDEMTKKKQREDDVKLEGCLSLCDVWGVVVRHDGVKLSYTDLSGKRNTQIFTGFLATILQHEVDHLHGILFPKRALEQKGTLYKSKKNAEGELIFEEISI